VSAPDEPPASDKPDQYLRQPLVDEEQIALAAVSLKPTVVELLARHRAGEKNTLADYAHALLAIKVQYERDGKVAADFKSSVNAPVSVELIDLLAAEILGRRRVAKLEQRWAEIEDYRRRHPKATPSEIATRFAQPEVRGWSWRNLRRKISARLQSPGHSD
jgi:hypothetical protein